MVWCSRLKWKVGPKILWPSSPHFFKAVGLLPWSYPPFSAPTEARAVTPGEEILLISCLLAVLPAAVTVLLAGLLWLWEKSEGISQPVVWEVLQQQGIYPSITPGKHLNIYLLCKVNFADFRKKDYMIGFMGNRCTSINTVASSKWSFSPWCQENQCWFVFSPSFFFSFKLLCDVLQSFLLTDIYSFTWITRQKNNPPLKLQFIKFGIWRGWI